MDFFLILCYTAFIKNTDARKLKRDQLTDLRRRAVAAVREGEMPAMVLKVPGVGVRTVFGWLAKYRAGGWDALRAHRRGATAEARRFQAEAFV